MYNSLNGGLLKTRRNTHEGTCKFKQGIELPLQGKISPHLMVCNMLQLALKN